ncbi:MAG TPA: alpha/beta fold hydrolase [Gaiellaceae bacterium]|nr:alpha/beta fold hydrolase [Gaiellaceae bacterium]
MTTVVLCGSLGSSTSMWDPQTPALIGAGLDVVRVEHPGHGGAPVEPVADVADLAGRVLAHVDAARFSFVGLSLGGAVGMRLALDAPERIDRLALLCTSPSFAPAEQWRERAALVRAEGLEPIVDAVLARWFAPAFSDVRRFREMFLATDPEGYARCCDALVAWDARDQLERIEAPTLCVAGAEDPSTPPAELESIASRVPDARLEVVPGARHLANVERADEVNRLLLEHLS